MDEYYLGEIRPFAGNFVMSGWHLCDGTLLDIIEYRALFALLETRYGGDGVTNFALPDLRGRIPLGQSERNHIGDKGGAESVKLTYENLPAHRHYPACSTADQANSKGAADAFWSASPVGGLRYTAAPASGSQLNLDSIGWAGEGIAHENRMPIVAVLYVIALYGIFPSSD